MKTMSEAAGATTEQWSSLLSSAMEVKTQEEADACFEGLMAKVMVECPNRTDAEARLRSALGYHAGYYSHETRLRVERFFCCEHPIFGSAKNATPSPEEIFRMGVAMGGGSNRSLARRAPMTTEQVLLWGVYRYVATIAAAVSADSSASTPRGKTRTLQADKITEAARDAVLGAGITPTWDGVSLRVFLGDKRE
jgi:hypothetical protein